MTPYESESLALLRQILVAVQGGRGTTQPPASLAVASDSDLDGQHGDEEVRLSPRDWTGPPMKGRRMSECPPAFLDLLAETLDYFAKKNAASNAMTTSGKPKADFDRRGAARARGWAARLRAGWKPAEFDAAGDAPPDSSYGAPVSSGFDFPTSADDDIPFAWVLPLLLPAAGAAHVLLRAVAA